jgi:hypothetical protein
LPRQQRPPKAPDIDAVQRTIRAIWCWKNPWASSLALSLSRMSPLVHMWMHMRGDALR